MKEDLTRYTCDVCGKKVDIFNQRYGVPPDCTWVSVSYVAPYQRSNFGALKQLNFCCPEHAIQHLTEKVVANGAHS